MCFFFTTTISPPINRFLISMEFACLRSIICENCILSICEQNIVIIYAEDTVWRRNSKCNLPLTQPGSQASVLAISVSHLFLVSRKQTLAGQLYALTNQRLNKNF